MYKYNITDHLGNVRAEITPYIGAPPLVTQARNYYTFGMEMSQLNNNGSYNNRYLYNGKELQNDFGLYWYDYGARFYDPMIGRWHTQDPMAEVSRRWSPYSYCMDNPLRFVDVDGMYSTEEWKKDHGVTDDMLTTIYQASDSNDSSDGDKDKSKEDNSKSRGDQASKSPLAIIPAVGPAFVSGQYLDEGEYLEAAIWEAYAFADLFTLGYASKFKLAERAAKGSTSIVQLGKWGESRLAQVLGNAGTKPSSPFRTSLGNRYVDRLVNGIAHEAKAGYNVKLTPSIRTQIMKDVELINSGQIRGAQWHFFNGADNSVLNFLNSNGIPYIVY